MLAVVAAAFGHASANSAMVDCTVESRVRLHKRCAQAQACDCHVRLTCRTSMPDHRRTSYTFLKTRCLPSQHTLHFSLNGPIASPSKGLQSRICSERFAILGHQISGLYRQTGRQTDREREREREREQASERARERERERERARE